MKTVYYTAVSLDGFIADADNALDWLFQFGDPDPAEWAAFEARLGAIAMGATTYRWVLDNDIMRPGADPKPWPYRQPTWVFTHRTFPVPPGGDIRFVQGDVRPVHAGMAAAAAGRDIWLVGGGDLVGQFWDAGLLDEIIVTVAPVTLGGGAPLLPRAITRPPLRLRSVRQVTDAFVELTYDVQRA